MIWNPIKAAIRTFNPREKKFVVPESKFKRSMLVNSVNRLKDFGMSLAAVGNYIRSCLNWESKTRSICALIVFILVVYFIELYHVPIILLLLFVRFHVYKKVAESIELRFRSRSVDSVPSFNESDDEEFDAQVGF